MVTPATRPSRRLHRWSDLKWLCLLHGRVGDSTDVYSLSPLTRQLINDAVAFCCGDIAGDFGLIRNEIKKKFELKLKKFSCNIFDVSQIFSYRVVQARPKYSNCTFLERLCWVSVC